MDGGGQTQGIPRWMVVLAVGRNPKRTLIRLAVLVVAAILIPKFVLLPVRVVGGSMEPNFHNGSINIVNLLAYRNSAPRRGDVVGIRMAGEHVMLMKRVVGLPGESISFVDGNVCVDGVRLEEPYRIFPSDWTVPPITLGSNMYYFVGDNRSMNPNDHTHGSADRSQIVGRFVLSGGR
jgi:signal peptidase I